MKFVAITPDWMRAEALIERLDTLEAMQVSFLYLRTPALHGSLGTLLPEIVRTGIMPILPVGVVRPASGIRAGIHFRSSDIERLNNEPLAPDVLKTASSQGVEEAARLLERGVEYVFVSPVFPPLSKPMDASGSGMLFPRPGLRQLAERYGERVVALGGMDRGRIVQLEKELGADFSVAGITFFFGAQGP